MTNNEVVEAFVNGEETGHSGTLHIVGDKLYSYAMPIAKRVAGGFEISNHMRALGGKPVSQTTSAHIGSIHHSAKYLHSLKVTLVDTIS